jgi:hypothetical protein
MGLFPENVPTSIHEYLFGKELVCWVSLTGMSREVGFYFNNFYIFHFFKSCILVSYCRLIILTFTGVPNDQENGYWKLAIGKMRIWTLMVAVYHRVHKIYDPDFKNHTVSIFLALVCALARCCVFT